MSFNGIVSEHHGSFLAESGGSTIRVLVRLYGPAGLSLTLLSTLAGFNFVSFDSVPIWALASTLGLLGGVLFSLGIALLGKAMDNDTVAREPGPETSKAAMRLRALAANALFTSALCIGGATITLIGTLFPALECGFVIAGTAALIAVITSLFFVSGRIFSEVRRLTTKSRT